MTKANVLASEAFLDGVVFHRMPCQVLGPKTKRPFRYGVGGGGDLSGPLAAPDPLIGEGGHDRAGVGVRVGVVQMIVGVSAVEENGLFEQPLTNHPRDEIKVFLRTAGAQRDVMDSCDGHETAPFGKRYDVSAADYT